MTVQLAKSILSSIKDGQVVMSVNQLSIPLHIQSLLRTAIRSVLTSSSEIQPLFPLHLTSGTEGY
jgi:hypothetical protein